MEKGKEIGGGGRGKGYGDRKGGKGEWKRINSRVKKIERKGRKEGYGKWQRNRRGKGGKEYGEVKRKSKERGEQKDMEKGKEKGGEGNGKGKEKGGKGADSYTISSLTIICGSNSAKNILNPLRSTRQIACYPRGSIISKDYFILYVFKETYIFGVSLL